MFLFIIIINVTFLVFLRFIIYFLNDNEKNFKEI